MESVRLDIRMSTDNNPTHGSGNAEPGHLGRTGPAKEAGNSIVLVVEDDALVRKAVGRAIQNAGYEVVLVPTAADALIVIQRLRFQVLVLDLHLYDPDPFNGIHEGFGVLDWLQRQVGGYPILGGYPFRVIVHTAQASQHLMRKADAYGVFAFCIKRRDMSNLVQCIAEAVQSLKMP
jgi:CheY-like chemotaxis protein